MSENGIVRKKCIRKQCSVEGCENRSQIGGVCCKHGAKPKRCSIEGCEKSIYNRWIMS